MKGLKEFFRMIVTAVICFGMKLFCGGQKEKKVSLISGKFETGELSFENTISAVGCGDTDLTKYSWNPFIRKVLFWKQGPGDRIGKFPSAWSFPGF